MKINLISIIVILTALLINIFLISAAYYAKHKGDTKFGRFSRDFDKLISKEITEIKGMFSKKKN